MANWYVSSTKWSAVTAWSALTVNSVGDIRRQLATPTVGNERVFRCTTPGTTGATEPPWTLTKGGTTNDGTVVWTEITGQAAYNGDGGGTNYGAPHARVPNATVSTWAAAGDTVYVDGGNAGANPHAATQASAIAITSQGTAASWVKILCVDNANVPPTTIAATASETSSSGSLGLSAGFYSIDGIKFVNSATSSNLYIGPTSASISGSIKLNNCILQLSGNNATPVIQIGSSNASGIKPSSIKISNTNFLFANASQCIVTQNSFSELVNCNFATSGTVPSTLFKPANNGNIIIRDSDLSAITGTLASATNSLGSVIELQNCKLGSGVALVTGTINYPGAFELSIQNCDSGNTNYREALVNYSGTYVSESTVVANDWTGAKSRAVTTTANVSFDAPFELKPIQLWNNSTSGITASIEIASNTQLDDNDIWVDFEYPGSATLPTGVVATTKVSSSLATATNYPTGDASWNSPPTYNQKMSATFTPGQAGWIKARVFVAIPSTQIYVDRTIRIGGAVQNGRHSILPGLGAIDETGGGGLLVHPGMNGGMRG